MLFGKLDIYPPRNPAVLDTATWDPNAARQLLAAPGEAGWSAARRAIWEGRDMPRTEGVTLHVPSLVHREDAAFCLATLADGQEVLIEFGPGAGRAVLEEPLAELAAGSGARAWAYATGLEAVARYVETLHTDKAPRAMGAVPRLGIGSRMTTASWPGSRTRCARPTCWRTCSRGGRPS